MQKLVCQLDKLPVEPHLPSSNQPFSTLNTNIVNLSEMFWLTAVSVEEKEVHHRHGHVDRQSTLEIGTERACGAED